MPDAFSDTPVPLADPSVLTTRQTLREVNNLRELIETRLDGIDREFKRVAQFPTDADKALTSLRDILTERFLRVEQVIELQGKSLQEQLNKGLSSEQKATALALESVNKATAISQQTADRAVAKAEAAADKIHLQNMIDALRNNFEGQIQAAKEALAANMASQEKAVTKAEMATEKRFEGVNEFRAQLSDQASRFMPRTEAEAWSSSNADKISSLASRMDRLEGRSGGIAAGWGVIVSVVVVATGILGAIMVLIGNN